MLPEGSVRADTVVKVNRVDTRDLKRLTQPVSVSKNSFLPEVVSEIPWGHNIAVFQKLKQPPQRLWYAHQTVANGWSRSMLEHWTESGRYARQGKAVTKFQ